MDIDLNGKHPVIIAGAGPVGCTLALYLARHNIPIILLEAEKKRLKFNILSKIRQMLPKFILNIIRFLRSPKYNP